MIATVTISDDNKPDGIDGGDSTGLQDIIMIVLDRHFARYAAAADAQKEYLQMTALIAADTPFLFGLDEARRAGLAACPSACAWADFEREASTGIAPSCFSIRFTELT